MSIIASRVWSRTEGLRDAEITEKRIKTRSRKLRRPASRKRAERNIVRLLAGFIAENFLPEGADAAFYDFLHVSQQVERYGISEARLSALWNRTERLVARYWSAIERAAEALLEKETLTARDVRRLMKAGAPARPRGLECRRGRAQTAVGGDAPDDYRQALEVLRLREGEASESLPMTRP